MILAYDYSWIAEKLHANIHHGATLLMKSENLISFYDILIFFRLYFLWDTQRESRSDGGLACESYHTCGIVYSHIYILPATSEADERS